MPADWSYCMDVHAMSFSVNDVTDFNSAYPGMLTVTCTDCNGDSGTLSQGEDYTPDAGCEWNTTFQFDG